jgi:hypothetical protein
MRPITYSLQFRGSAHELDGGLRKHARAPGCSLVTSLTPHGLEARYVWSGDDDEALLESTLTFLADGRFEEEGTIRLPRGHALRVRGRGRLAASADPHLRHGTVVWDVAGGAGQFERATGHVTSNFFLSDTGELTENQLGVVFPNEHAPGDADQGSPRREHLPLGETIDAAPGKTGSTRRRQA